ncbi:MAG: hypothetical protein HZA90_02345 [Verrucomicrobia bacterium]|nr:hypothetical protein [Verrucomicrobiota bacterium]
MNTKEPQLLDRFVELRAHGWTFARLKAELQTAKPALIAWSRKHHHRLSNLRAVEYEAVANRCHVSRRVCAEPSGPELTSLLVQPGQVGSSWDPDQDQAGTVRAVAVAVVRKFL